MEDEKKVPVGVWIFWTSVGLLVIVRLIPSQQGPGNTLGLIVNFVSALGAVGAASVAFLTVRELRGQRKEERINRRPYFSFVEGRIGKAYDDEAQYGESPYVEFKLRQVGKNPAADLTVTITILMPADNGHATEVVTARAVNDIASGFDYDFSHGGLHLDITQHQYVVFDLDYYDAIYGFRFQSQRFYLQWNGLDPFNHQDTSDRLYPITREAKPLVLSMLAAD